MTLSAFTARVSRELNRGSAYDSVIPDKIRDAVRALERNYSFQYMQRFVELTLAANTRSVAFPAKLKSTRFMRYSSTDGGYVYLTRVDPRQVSAMEVAAPTGYWMDGRQWIWFDNTPDEATTIEWNFFQYTTWPLVGDSNYADFDHFLLDIGEDVLLYGTLVELGHTIREPELLQSWGALFQGKVQTLNHADIEAEYSNEDARMVYE